MSTAILAPGITSPTYTSGPAIDIAETPYYNIRNLSNLIYWGRADSALDDIGGGFKASLPDKRTGSTRAFRQPTGQTAVIAKSTTPGFLRNRATLLFDATTDGAMPLSDNILPTSGNWAIYMALHMLPGGYNRLLGNSSGSNLAISQVNNEIRLSITASSPSPNATATIASGAQSRDVLLGFFRRPVSTSSKLAIRYKFAGQAWQDVEAANFCTTDGLVGGTPRTVLSSLTLGAYTTPATSYAFNGRLAQFLLFGADVGYGSGSVREKVEEYLVNYHGMS